MSIKYQITQDSITVLVRGVTHLIQKGAPTFHKLREALLGGVDAEIETLLNSKKAIEVWSKGQIKDNGDHLQFEDMELSSSLKNRIDLMMASNESPQPMLNFLSRLQRNPSFRSVQQLWSFLEHAGIPLTKEGRLLAYKSVSSTLMDHHTGKVDNSPGAVNTMARNKISDDPDISCHYGFHVGSLSYAQDFGAEDRYIVVCEVDPEHVVCVPRDHSSMKMRVSDYIVVGHHSGELLSSTSYEEEECEEEDEEECFDDFWSRPISLVTPLESVVVTVPGNKSKALRNLDSLTLGGLMEESIEALRKYASKNLSITGASKIPGGKVALIKKIIQVRKAAQKRKSK